MTEVFDMAIGIVLAILLAIKLAFALGILRPNDRPPEEGR